VQEARDFDRRLRELERRCDADFTPLAARIDAVTTLANRIVDEIGGLHAGENPDVRPIRARLHHLEKTEAGNRLVAQALKSRGGTFRDRVTLILAAAAALGSVRPWEWF
jgi:hypothetical protein